MAETTTEWTKAESLSAGIPIPGMTDIANTTGGVSVAPVPTSYNFTYEQAVARNMQQDVKTAAEQAAIDAAIAAGPSSTSTSITGTPPMPTSTLTPTSADGEVV